MRYKDWKNEVVTHHDEASRLEKLMERKVLIRDEPDGRLYLHVRVLAWGTGPDDAHVSFTISHDRMGFIHDPLTVLTAIEMTLVADVKSWVQAWTEDRIDELPATFTSWIGKS